MSEQFLSRLFNSNRLPFTLSGEAFTTDTLSEGKRSLNGHKNKTTQINFAKHFAFGLYRGALAFSA